MRIMFTLDYLMNLVLLFFTFSVLGWFMEVALKYRQFHRFINRGFLIGPYLPIYGTGVTLATLLNDIISVYDASVGTTFVTAFIACGTLEYFVSWYLEKRFHARWWDYSQKPMNLNGRVWIGNLILFGIGGTAVVYLIDPPFFRLAGRLPQTVKMYLCIADVCIMTADSTVSHFIMKLLKSGIEKSDADNTEAIGNEIRAMMADKTILHRRFVNAYPEVVYRTDRIKQRLRGLKESTEVIRQEVADRLAEEKADIIYRMEPTAHIKSAIIEDQRQLIELLDSGSGEPEREKALRQAIDEKTRQLEQREHSLKKLKPSGK